MLQAAPFLDQFGYVAIAVEALSQAVVAKRVIAERGSTPHLAAKAANLAFVVAHLLPRATALGKVVTSGDESCLDPELFAY
jgi:hypothetical protein